MFNKPSLNVGRLGSDNTYNDEIEVNSLTSASFRGGRWVKRTTSWFESGYGFEVRVGWKDRLCQGH